MVTMAVLLLAGCATAPPAGDDALAIGPGGSVLREERRQLARLYLGIGEVYDRELQDYAKAAQEYRKYLELEPEGEGAERVRGRLRKLEENLSKAPPAAPLPQEAPQAAAPATPGQAPQVPSPMVLPPDAVLSVPQPEAMPATPGPAPQAPPPTVPLPEAVPEAAPAMPRPEAAPAMPRPEAVPAMPAAPSPGPPVPAITPEAPAKSVPAEPVPKPAARKTSTRAAKVAAPSAAAVKAPPPEEQEPATAPTPTVNTPLQSWPARDFSGKPVPLVMAGTAGTIILYWDTITPRLVTLMAAVSRLSGTRPGAWRVVTVTRKGSPDLPSYLREKGIDLSVVEDANGILGKALGGGDLPALAILSVEGRLLKTVSAWDGTDVPGFLTLPPGK